ncbi:MAG TPA: hypothetical protein PL029_10025 [Bacteroidia bacterium]|nr:hypothetical protein [Bacteroidia bacterium]
MGALMVLSFGLMMFLGLPTLTYFYAKQLGRNPWRWFAIGIILPGIATLILSFMPDLSEKEEKKRI